MAVNLSEPTELRPVPGIRLGTAATGLKEAGRDDVAVVVFDPGASVAGVFTQSHFQAAPVIIAKRHAQGVRAWVINSGNANAATGAPGEDDARAVCAHLAERAGLELESIQPFSTGVIGERLNVAAIQHGVDRAFEGLSPASWLASARAIMTTDTVAKGASQVIQVDGHLVTISGFAKGSGMIKPNMATMLSFIGCDAQIEQSLLQRLVQRICDASFHRITVDGDTSTNDAFMVAATGQAAHRPILSEDDPGYQALYDGLLQVAQTLAHAIVRDGEGATKFVAVRVKGGATAGECLSVAYTLAESPLVKTALFAGDANWGRLCMAIGRSDVAQLDPAGVSLWLDQVQVAAGGLMAPDYTDGAGSAVLAQDEYTITVDLGRGDSEETVWTTDLSYDYIKINAEYRT